MYETVILGIQYSDDGGTKSLLSYLLNRQDRQERQKSLQKGKTEFRFELTSPDCSCACEAWGTERLGLRVCSKISEYIFFIETNFQVKMH